MRLIRVLKHEITYNYQGNLKKLLILAVIAIFISISGMPYEWVLFNGWILYGVLEHCQRLIKKEEYNLLVKSQNRMNWFFSKILWSIVFVVISYCVIYCVMEVFWKINGNPGNYIFSNLIFSMFLESVETATMLEKLIPLLLTMNISLLLIVLLLFVKSIVAFVIAEGVLLMVEFMTVLIYDGNGILQFYLRNLLEQSITYKEELWLCKVFVFAGLLCVLVGMCRFGRYDVR